MKNMKTGLVASVVLVTLASAPAIACKMSEIKPGANCAGANFEDVNLRELARTGRIPWYLDDINLEGANLRYVNLEDMNMPGANLKGAKLEGADLSKADLRGANLRNAVLELSDITGTFFFGADLRGANLAGANQKRPAVFDGAILPHE